MSCHPEASPGLVVRSAPLLKTFSVLCVVASIALSLSLVIAIIKRRRISMFTVSDEVVTLFFFFFFCRHAHQLHRSWRAVVAAAGLGSRRRKRREKDRCWIWWWRCFSSSSWDWCNEFCGFLVSVLVVPLLSLFVALLLLHWFLDCEDSRFALPCLLACQLRSHGCSISRSSLVLRPPSSAAPRSSACSPPFFLQVSLLVSSSCSWRLFVALAAAPVGVRGRNVWKRRPGPSAVYLSLESGPWILCYGGSVWCSTLVCCNESAIKDWFPAYVWSSNLPYGAGNLQFSEIFLVDFWSWFSSILSVRDYWAMDRDYVEKCLGPRFSSRDTFP